MNSALLRLYPAGFRRAFGDELADAFREATEGASAAARFRETCDVVAHALRLRLGLGSARRGGRLFAAVAPFALVATAAYAAFNLVSVLGDWYVSQNGDFLVPMSYALMGCHLLALVGAVTALGGRFVIGRWCALLGMVGAAACLLLPVLPSASAMPLQLTAYLLAPLLVAAAPLACPPDLRPAPRIRSAAGVAALVMWVPLVVAGTALVQPAGFGGLLLWRYGVPLLAALVLAGRGAFSGVRTAGQLALSGAGFVLTGFCAGLLDWDSVPSALTVVAGSALAMRLLRGTKSGTATPS
ncbi:hypothetical protein [Streptomyces sp. NPDC048111]|uniref:hypothetical protein n=1 Tax=Streptomyces sp. NPDC048111 TaxID=3365500 RepID=UPI0037233396